MSETKIKSEDEKKIDQQVTAMLFMAGIALVVGLILFYVFISAMSTAPAWVIALIVVYVLASKMKST